MKGKNMKSKTIKITDYGNNNKVVYEGEFYSLDSIFDELDPKIYKSYNNVEITTPDEYDFTVYETEEDENEDDFAIERIAEVGSYWYHPFVGFYANKEDCQKAIEEVLEETDN
jgi:hypothetical protein